MKRRMFLGSLAAVGAAGTLGGCLGAFGDSNPNVTLGKPDREHPNYDPQYPIWNDRLPDVTVPSPIEARDISVRSVETPTLFTFFFSHCMTVCPVLISTLRQVQTHALNNGYGDEITFLPITFDPARDDAERLQTYAQNMNIAYKKDNWHFLRPSSKKHATQVIEKEFGVMFHKQDPKENNSGYMFAHTPLTILANADGYVERAYKTKSPSQQTIIDDLKQLR
jgi:protein SCO1/2